MRLDRHASFGRQERRLNTPSERQVHRVPLWRRAAVWPLAAVVRLWWTTVTICVSEEDRRVVEFQGEPTTFILWHNRLFLAAEIIHRFRKGRPLYSLISGSRDGSWLAAFFAAVGLRAVRGSSNRQGHEAASALVDVLQSGFDVGITPDGPKGPVYEMKPGALIVARRTRCRVVLVGMDFESSWRLASWDGFHIPRPFSKVHMRFEAFGTAALDERDEAARQLGRRLVELNPDRAPAPVRRRA
jgi:lysophospholipid acyltransferase (LPLAT)-like uncharacterized protein